MEGAVGKSRGDLLIDAVSTDSQSEVIRRVSDNALRPLIPKTISGFVLSYRAVARIGCTGMRLRVKTN